MTAKNNRTAFLKLQEYARRSELFKPGEAGADGHSEEWSGVIFRLGDARLACNIDRVQEILTPLQATPVPGAKAWILGLANVRGALMTVIDLGGYLNGVRTPVTPRTRVLSTGSPKAPLGLLIDEVFGQRHFLTTDAGTPELDNSSPLRGLVARQYRMGSECWNELELDQLFKSTEFMNGAAT